MLRLQICLKTSPLTLSTLVADKKISNFSRFFQKHKEGISRTIGPILGFFVLIWMHFSCCIPISWWKFESWKFCKNHKLVPVGCALRHGESCASINHRNVSCNWIRRGTKMDQNFFLRVKGIHFGNVNKFLKKISQGWGDNFS